MLVKKNKNILELKDRIEKMIYEEGKHFSEVAFILGYHKEYFRSQLKLMGIKLPYGKPVYSYKFIRKLDDLIDKGLNSVEISKILNITLRQFYYLNSKHISKKLCKLKSKTHLVCRLSTEELVLNYHEVDKTYYMVGKKHQISFATVKKYVNHYSYANFFDKTADNTILYTCSVCSKQERYKKICLLLDKDYNKQCVCLKCLPKKRKLKK